LKTPTRRRNIDGERKTFYTGKYKRGVEEAITFVAMIKLTLVLLFVS
jgi:hypothetical protein